MQSLLAKAVPLAAMFALLGGCASDPKAAYEQEDFSQSHTYSRSYQSDYKVACDAGRRALLSQGYNIDRFSDAAVSGHKNFLDESGRNTQITFNVNCAPDGTGPNRSQVFANAVQDSYSLKKTSSAASVGVGILGSLSLPFVSTDDSLVKTSSLTVTRPQFYGGFFDLLQQYLPVAQAVVPAKPETPPAPERKPAPALPPVQEKIVPPALPESSAPAESASTAEPVPTVPLTPENTGIAKQPAVIVEPPAGQAGPAPTPAPPPGPVAPAAPPPFAEPPAPVAAPDAEPAGAPAAKPQEQPAAEAVPAQ